MGTIKLKRGSGTPPNSSLAQYEVAMDVADKTVYTSTDGTDAVILADSTEQWLANNTVSDLSTEGLFNETSTYAHIVSSTRINNTLPTQLTAMEITRDLGSDGAVAGYEERCASLDFRIQSDATNTNNAPQNLYAGGFMGGSGSNDASLQHWIAGFTYDASNPSTKHTIFEGTKNSMEINPRIRAKDGADIEDPDAELNDAVVNIKVDQSGYNRAHIMCEDSNAKAFSIIGESDDVNQNRDKFIVTLDPDNIHSPNNVTTYAGDYGVYYLKEYGNINNPAIEMNVFGAKDAFKLRVFDDFNGGTDSYDYRPMEIYAEQLSVKARDGYSSAVEVLRIDQTDAKFEVPIMPPLLTSTQRNALSAAEGMIIYNTDDTRVEYYDGSDWRYISGTVV